jgi:uncharacterized RDD family membrane protein YckC
MDTIPVSNNIPTVPPPPVPPPTVPMPPDINQTLPQYQTQFTTAPVITYEYAGFWSRLLAVFLDALIMGAISIAINFTIGIFSAVMGAAGSSIKSTGAQAGTSVITGIVTMVGGLIQMVLSVAYYVYFTGKSGQTLGKKALNIRVVNPDTALPPGYGYAALREIIGKTVSSLIFCLGYLWMLWDDKKQTWHDKIAHTVVIKA